MIAPLTATIIEVGNLERLGGRPGVTFALPGGPDVAVEATKEFCMAAAQHLGKTVQINFTVNLSPAAPR
jgi:hypothetical protein